MEDPIVLVTGVSGYIAAWVAYCLLKQGYRVRGTVRSLSNESKLAHLRDLCPSSKHKIELVEADLNSSAGWNEAVQGTTFVMHLASPFPLDHPKDKFELIRPAVDGTLHVLRAVVAASPRPKRVVLTSSFAAIGYGQESFPDRPFNESNWTVTDDSCHPIDAYTESKVLAERAAWDFLNSLKDEEKFELCTVNPTFVQGPMLSPNGCSSAELPMKILLKLMPSVVDMDMFVTHVYDVAKVHLLAMTNPNAAGKRFLCNGGVCSLISYAHNLAEEFEPQGYSCTTKAVPYLAVWIGSFFDKQASNILPSVGKRYYIQGENVKNILGYDVQTDVRGTVLYCTIDRTE